MGEDASVTGCNRRFRPDPSLAPAPKGLESTGDCVMNLPWTQAGLPVISLPSELSKNGLPMGLQVIGRWMEDERLFDLAGHLAWLLK